MVSTAIYKWHMEELRLDQSALEILLWRIEQLEDTASKRRAISRALAELASGTVENTLWMRAWTACFQTRHFHTTQEHYVSHYRKYEKWLTYHSGIVPHWRIRW